MLSVQSLDEKVRANLASRRSGTAN
jgi:hypothetical protein